MYKRLFLTVILAAVCLGACTSPAPKNVPHNQPTSATSPSPSNAQISVTKTAGTPLPLEAILVSKITPTLKLSKITPIPLFTVTKTTLIANPTAYNGPCLHMMPLSFDGTITVSAAGTVKYHFIINGGTGPVQTLVFNAAGTKNVSDSGMVGNSSGTPGQTMSNSGQIYIDSPNHKGMAIANWTMVCNMQVNTPTPTLEVPR